MTTIDSQNYYVQHGVVLPRQPRVVEEVDPARPTKEQQSQRLPQPNQRAAIPRAERFARVRGAMDDSTLSLRSRHALDAYSALEQNAERDELSTMLGIDTYA